MSGLASLFSCLARGEGDVESVSAEDEVVMEGQVDVEDERPEWTADEILQREG